MVYVYETQISPIGNLSIKIDGESITNLWFENQNQIENSLHGEIIENNPILFEESLKWLEYYFSSNEPKALPSISPSGTVFQKMVWKILCQIPYGEVTTYGTIAKQISEITGKKMSAQAVGGAVGSNPIPIMIPCHRVVGADGNLTGFSGGIDRKIKLLEIENVNVSGFKLLN